MPPGAAAVEPRATAKGRGHLSSVNVSLHLVHHESKHRFAEEENFEDADNESHHRGGKEDE